MAREMTEAERRLIQQVPYTTRVKYEVRVPHFTRHTFRKEHAEIWAERARDEGKAYEVWMILEFRGEERFVVLESYTPPFGRLDDNHGRLTSIGERSMRRDERQRFDNEER